MYSGQVAASRASLKQDLLADLVDEPDLFCETDEFTRGDQTAIWMVPAHKRFEAAYCARADTHQWLIVDDEFLVCYRLFEFGAELTLRSCRHFEPWLKDTIAVAAILFCLVKR